MLVERLRKLQPKTVVRASVGLGILAVFVVAALRSPLLPQASTDPSSPSPSAQTVIVKGTIYEDGIPVKDADVYCLYKTVEDPNQWKKDIFPTKSRADGGFSCTATVLDGATEVPVVAQKGDEWCDAKATVTNGTTQPVTINLDKDKKGESKIALDPDPKQEKDIMTTASRIYPKATGGIQPVDPEPSKGIEPAFNGLRAGYYNILVEPAIEDKKCGRAAVGVTGADETIELKLPMDCKNEEYVLYLERGGPNEWVNPQMLKQAGYTGVLIYLTVDPGLAGKLKEHSDEFKALGMDFFMPTAEVRAVTSPNRRQLWANQTQVAKIAQPTGYWFSSWEELCGGGANRRIAVSGPELAAAANEAADVIHAIDPGKPLIIWGDAFDPYHNAVKHKDNAKKFKCPNDNQHANSWLTLSKDFIVINWNEKLESVAHWARLGNHVISGVFFDGKDSNSRFNGRYTPSYSAPLFLIKNDQTVYSWVACVQKIARNYGGRVEGILYYSQFRDTRELGKWGEAWHKQDQLACPNNVRIP